MTHNKSTFRSPKEYDPKCADQTDSIDVFSLGNVFFFLLSDGEKPYYQLRGPKNFPEAVGRIGRGVWPELPGPEEYYYDDSEDDGDEEVEASFRAGRTDHPAYQALVEVMHKCWAYDSEKRPTSLEVVVMLEDAVRRIEDIM